MKKCRNCRIIVKILIIIKNLVGIRKRYYEWYSEKIQENIQMRLPPTRHVEILKQTTIERLSIATYINIRISPLGVSLFVMECHLTPCMEEWDEIFELLNNPIRCIWRKRRLLLVGLNVKLTVELRGPSPAWLLTAATWK
jgi:hypothetical protein